jgi:hypothetical protein
MMMPNVPLLSLFIVIPTSARESGSYCMNRQFGENRCRNWAIS